MEIPKHPDDDYMPDPAPKLLAPIPSAEQRKQELNQLLREIAGLPPA